MHRQLGQASRYRPGCRAPVAMSSRSHRPTRRWPVAIRTRPPPPHAIQPLYFGPTTRVWSVTGDGRLTGRLSRGDMMVESGQDGSITAVNCHAFLVRRDGLLNANWSFIDSDILPPATSRPSLLLALAEWRCNKTHMAKTNACRMRSLGYVSSQMKADSVKCILSVFYLSLCSLFSFLSINILLQFIFFTVLSFPTLPWHFILYCTVPYYCVVLSVHSIFYFCIVFSMSSA